MKKWKIAAAVGVALAAFAALGVVLFKSASDSGSNDMSGLLPPPRANARKMPPNPYAAQIKADSGKGGKYSPPTAGR